MPARRHRVEECPFFACRTVRNPAAIRLRAAFFRHRGVSAGVTEMVYGVLYAVWGADRLSSARRPPADAALPLKSGSMNRRAGNRPCSTARAYSALHGSALPCSILGGRAAAPAAAVWPPVCWHAEGCWPYGWRHQAPPGGRPVPHDGDRGYPRMNRASVPSSPTGIETWRPQRGQRPMKAVRSWLG